METKWSENVILADAEYIDKVAFDLIVNFERMIGRRIPQADMARWVECIAMDGRLKPGDHETQVILVHDHLKTRMENFVPSDYKAELDGQAFKGELGEFVFSAITTEGLTTKEDLFLDTLQLLASQKEVKRMMVIGDERLFAQISEALRSVDDEEKRVTVFAMQPRQGRNFRCEILGYSLMAALGIRSDEIHPSM